MSDKKIFHICISKWVEADYASSEFSFTRNNYSFTIHEDWDEAYTKALHEINFCFLPSQILLNRRCGVLTVEVPERVISRDDMAARWAGDRLPELSRRAGMGEEENLGLAVSMAFHQVSEGKPYALDFLQIALAIKHRSGNSGLIELLKTASGMSREAVISLKPAIEHMTAGE